MMQEVGGSSLSIKHKTQMVLGAPTHKNEQGIAVSGGQRALEHSGTKGGLKDLISHPTIAHTC